MEAQKVLGSTYYRLQDVKDPRTNTVVTDGATPAWEKATKNGQHVILRQVSKGNGASVYHVVPVSNLLVHLPFEKQSELGLELHEIIPKGTPHRLFFDIDFAVKGDAKKKETEILRDVVGPLIRDLGEFDNNTLCRYDEWLLCDKTYASRLAHPVILSGTRKGKVSLHVVFGVWIRDTETTRRLMTAMLESNKSAHEARLKCVDMAVYRPNGGMRTVGSQKEGVSFTHLTGVDLGPDSPAEITYGEIGGDWDAVDAMGDEDIEVLEQRSYLTTWNYGKRPASFGFRAGSALSKQKMTAVSGHAIPPRLWTAVQNKLDQFMVSNKGLYKDKGSTMKLTITPDVFPTTRDGLTALGSFRCIPGLPCPTKTPGKLLPHESNTTYGQVFWKDANPPFNMESGFRVEMWCSDPDCSSRSHGVGKRKRTDVKRSPLMSLNLGRSGGRVKKQTLARVQSI